MTAVGHRRILLDAIAALLRFGIVGLRCCVFEDFRFTVPCLSWRYGASIAVAAAR